MSVSLRTLKSFGNVAAEDDPVLQYFLSTDAVKRISSGDIMLVLGRKGTGKTAIVRHFTENQVRARVALPLNLRNYPWQIHESKVDAGASPTEAYVASWRYVIASQLASASVSHPLRANESSESIIKFFNENYGAPNPKFTELFYPKKLKLGKMSFEPQILGFKLGSIELSSKDEKFGREIDALSDGLLEAAAHVNRSKVQISLHFDELDQGLAALDEKRKAMLVGLILAAKSVNQKLTDRSLFNVIVYLRSDIWDDLVFSDKNKMSNTHSLNLTWDEKNLLALINERLRANLDNDVRWDDVSESRLMRGSQKKWNHILARTFLRPRDVIHFLNIALAKAKLRDEEPLNFINEDIVESRDEYSLYLKKELDDEIVNHWPHWDEALHACSRISTVVFDKKDFVEAYNSVKSPENQVSALDALRQLYNFSVIAYERRSGYGGSGWTFRYAESNTVWDNSATRFKVHLGLKEYAKLKEGREPFNWSIA